MAILRKQGLISKTAYRGKASGSSYKLVRKYRDVVEGRAIAAKSQTKLIPKAIRKQYLAKGGRLVIPKPKGTIRTTIKREKKGIAIRRTRKTPRGIVREEVVGGGAHGGILRTNQIYRVVMPNWGGESARYYRTQAELNAFLDWYDNLAEWLDISRIDIKDTPYWNDTFGPMHHSTH